MGTLLGCLLLSCGCNNSNRPTAPSSLPTAPPATVQPLPPVAVPPGAVLTGTYVFNASSSYPISHYTSASRYLVRNSGNFSLQYVSLGLEYVGAYTEENGRVTFRFAVDGRWDAVGTLDGDSLDVRYNVVMEFSDFENAVYKRSQ